MPSRRVSHEHHQRRRPELPGRDRAPEPAQTDSGRAAPPTLAIRLTRYGLPAAILLAGVITAVLVPGETGLDAIVGLGGVCACVVLLNLLLRLGASGDRDRVREAAAREYYDAHGRWPVDDRSRPGG